MLDLLRIIFIPGEGVRKEALDRGVIKKFVDKRFTREDKRRVLSNRGITGKKLDEELDKFIPEAILPPDKIFLVTRKGDTREGVTGEGVTGEGVTGEGVTGEGVTGEGVTGEGVTGEEVTGEEVTGEGVTGEGVTGEEVTGEGKSYVIESQSIAISYTSGKGPEEPHWHPDEVETYLVSDVTKVAIRFIDAPEKHRILIFPAGRLIFPPRVCHFTDLRNHTEVMSFRQHSTMERVNCGKCHLYEGGDCTGLIESVGSFEGEDVLVSLAKERNDWLKENR